MRDILAFELFLQSCSLLYPIPFQPVLKYFYPLVLKNAEGYRENYSFISRKGVPDYVLRRRWPILEDDGLKRKPIAH